MLASGNTIPGAHLSERGNMGVSFYIDSAGTGAILHFVGYGRTCTVYSLLIYRYVSPNVSKCVIVFQSYHLLGFLIKGLVILGKYHC